ncbi:hypothetical protein HYX14_05995 [Candidatus Woesearchaeota archaeon]|nr:hypothetical protein [Candidatus Woesearchaeota archaeon]
MKTTKKASAVLSLFFLLAVLVLSAVLYFTLKSELQRLILLVVFIMAILFSGFLIGYEFLTRASKLRRKVRRIEKLIQEESLEVIRKLYGEMYDLYLNLPDRHKANFYARLLRIRERIEEQLQAEKQVQMLLSRAGMGTLSAQKKILEELNQYAQKLSKKVQQKYSADILRFKEKLEKGA